MTITFRIFYNKKTAPIFQIKQPLFWKKRQICASPDEKTPGADSEQHPKKEKTTGEGEERASISEKTAAPEATENDEEATESPTAEKTEAEEPNEDKREAKPGAREVISGSELNSLEIGKIGGSFLGQFLNPNLRGFFVRNYRQNNHTF